MRATNKYVSYGARVVKRYAPKPVKALGRKVLKKQSSRLKADASIKPPELSYGENTVINHPKLHNGARIVFGGKNNILYLESPDIVIDNCKIHFHGDNSVMYISKNKQMSHHVNLNTFNDSTLYIGKDVSFYKSFRTDIVASEHTNIIIGDDCLFSLNIWFRTSDAHAAYDAINRTRLNPAKSILVGDHVWLGQNVTLLKGTMIGSGAIVGAGSITTGKALNSNSSYAGAPARELKKGVFFTKDDANKFSQSPDRHLKYDSDDWIYAYDKDSQLTLREIDDNLAAAPTSKEKLEYLKKYLAGPHNKNRFYIGEETHRPK